MRHGCTLADPILSLSHPDLRISTSWERSPASAIQVICPSPLSYKDASYALTGLPGVSIKVTLDIVIPTTDTCKERRGRWWNTIQLCEREREKLDRVQRYNWSYWVWWLMNEAKCPKTSEARIHEGMVERKVHTAEATHFKHEKLSDSTGKKKV